MVLAAIVFRPDLEPGHQQTQRPALRMVGLARRFASPVRAAKHALNRPVFLIRATRAQTVGCHTVDYDAPRDFPIQIV
eukprot:9373668-Lingulodinium_polyedra.AAC.1